MPERPEEALVGIADVLICQEWLDDSSVCGAPATHVAGIIEEYAFGYPACARCAGFWAKGHSRRLTQRERELILWALTWADEQSRLSEETSP